MQFTKLQEKKILLKFTFELQSMMHLYAQRYRSFMKIFNNQKYLWIQIIHLLMLPRFSKEGQKIIQKELNLELLY
ncbi:unnamed protein product [Paramecium sonneborni]|uniref:Uncharacterized protein n=1 Tax=Paramecium sonneborni TaxID=65129 RepID=A0A8S1RWS4_9CILI|nr:unnamed protein product [Paramecium sonneborni]